MNNENQQFKCNFCDAVFKQRQSKHKHSPACKKWGGEVNSFICEGCQKEFTRKDVLLKNQKGRCRGEEKRERKCLFNLCESSKLNPA